MAVLAQVTLPTASDCARTEPPPVIRFLSVHRLAVIDQLEIELGPGMSVLTGETGAGKSILVEAVGLLLGGRSSADLVRSGEETAIVQAVLDDALRRGADRQTRSLRPGPEPRLPRRTAGHDRGAARSGRIADRSARAARAPGAARSGDAARAARSLRRPRWRARRPGVRARAAGRDARGAGALRGVAADAGRAPRHAGVPASRDRQGVPAGGGGRRARGREDRRRQRREAGPARRGSLRRALRRRPRGDDQPGDGVEAPRRARRARPALPADPRGARVGDGAARRRRPGPCATTPTRSIARPSASRRSRIASPRSLV